jgi:tRNA(Ile2) C34 agmatinyltransferase TiaS
LDHKIIQLNPDVPEKTTNCVAVGVSFAVAEKDLPALTEHVIDFIRKNTYSGETTLAMFQGLRIPEEVQAYGHRAKREILRIGDAREVADRNEVRIVEVTGKRGTIGAVAGIGCFDMGPMAAALPDDVA